MVSASEQLAANMNLGAFAKATELKKRIWFTLGALVVYRLGTFVPLPGIDAGILKELFSSAGGITDMFNLFSGGALERMTIFALTIMPYISASIIMQLMAATVPSLEALKKEGEAGRKKINQYTRYGTVLLAAVQAWGLAVGLESWTGQSTASAVIDPGYFFRFSTTITLVGGTIFLMWLGEQITSRGIGNGISLIIFSGIVAGLPGALVRTFEQARQDQISPLAVLLLLLIGVGVIAFIVYMERAQRRILVQYPKRQVSAGRMSGGDSTHLPLKLNTSGVIPPIFASSLLLLPATFIGFQSTGATTLPAWLQFLQEHLAAGTPTFLALYALLIIFFCFFYTAIVFNPTETAENLRKFGGFVPGIRPGTNTSDYLDYVLTRITVLGAAYLVALCLMPEFLRREFNFSFYFGGTSLLIVVSVTMDTVAQIQSHLMAHQYEGLIKKARLRGARR